VSHSTSYLLGRAFGRLGVPARVAVVLGLAGLVSYCVNRTPDAPKAETPVPQANTPTPAPQPTAAQLEREREFREMLGGAMWLKKNMHNPKSFELVTAMMIQGKAGKAACYEYRGTNAFNAIVLNRRVITDNVNSGDAKDWNKYCAGRNGTDYTYVRRAL